MKIYNFKNNFKFKCSRDNLFYSGLFLNGLDLKVLNRVMLFYIFGFFYFINTTAFAVVYRYATFEWDQVPNTSIYETEVQNKANGDLQYFKSKDSVIELKLEPGNYLVRMRSYDLRGAPGKWGSERDLDIYPPDVQVQNQAQDEVVSGEDNVNYEFKWADVDSANKDLKYFLYIENQTSKEIKKVEVTGSKYSIELENRNAYKWWIVAIINEIEGLKPETVSDLTLRGSTLKKPILEIPAEGYVETVLWKSVENAETYEIELTMKKKEEWIKVDIGEGNNEKEEPYLVIPKEYKGGNYKIRVRAKAKYSKSSPWSEEKFYLKSGDRSKGAFQSFLLKTSLMLPTNKYFVASYLLTSIDYTSKYIFTNVNFKAIGGTGRLGMGYIKPKSSFGVYGIGDMSGFYIYGKARTYKSVEVHGFYRKKFDYQQFRISGGFFIRDLPELSSQNTLGTEAQFNSVSVLGPQVGFEYWQVINTKLGVQVNARYYQAMMGLQIPDKQPVVATPSFQIGLLGSLKLSQNIMGLAGYAFRKDQISYKVKAGAKDNRAGGLAATGNEINTITVQGHYLNLVLELGF